MDRGMDFYGKRFEPDVRTLSQMANVVMDRKWVDGAGDPELYFMFRDLAKREEDRAIMSEHDLRYDITIIPPGKLGIEYTKTYGHFHPDKVPGYTYTELYSVLEGEATYLLQKGSGGVIEDIYFVRAAKGDNVLIPPNYGHVTINAGDEPIKMANWVCALFSSEYKDIDRLCGAGYYLCEDGWRRNDNYGTVPEIRELPSTNFGDLGLSGGADVYDILYSEPSSLAYLSHPERFDPLWERVLSDRSS